MSAATLPVSSNPKRMLAFIEAAAAVLLRTFSRPMAKAGAVALGITLPQLPLLNEVYVLFAVSLIVLAWVKLRGESWASLGLVWPRRWLAQIGLGFLLFVLIVVYSAIAQPAIDQWVVDWTGANPKTAEEHFSSITGNTQLFLMILPLVWIFAAFGEEVFYRGFLITRFAQAFGEGRFAFAIAIILQAVLFGFAHSYQGPVGMVGTGILGLFFGIGATVWGRNLWPAMIAHGLADTLGFTLLYLGNYGD